MNIVPNSEGFNVFERNSKVGYVENDTLYAIDKDGYAEPIGVINHINEIEQMLTEWRNTNSSPTTQTPKS